MATRGPGGGRFGAIYALDGGAGADGARMHDAFFGSAKKAIYFFEPKLDLLRSELF